MTNDETFNPDEFLQGEMDGVLDTTVSLFPEGDSYTGTLVEITRARMIEPPAGADWKAFAVADVMFELHDVDAAAAELGRNTPVKVKGELRLDMCKVGDRYVLDAGKGRNLPLGRLYKANGLDQPGQRKSTTMLHGTGPYRLNLKHEEDRRDKDLPLADRRRYERIVSWVKV